MSRPRPLRELSDAMEALAPNSDWEVAHSDADRLLLEAIERLSAHATDTEDESETERLIAAWHEVGKWYA